MLDRLLALLPARQAAVAAPRPPAVGFAAAAPLSWASWGTGSYRVWTVSAGATRWFVSSLPQGFAVERRGPEGVVALTPAVSLRGAVARVMFDAWRRSLDAPRSQQPDLVAQSRQAGVPFGFLLDGPVR